MIRSPLYGIDRPGLPDLLVAPVQADGAVGLVGLLPDCDGALVGEGCVVGGTAPPPNDDGQNSSRAGCSWSCDILASKRKMWS